MERYKRNRWHRSKGEEIAATLLGLAFLAGGLALVVWVVQ